MRAWRSSSVGLRSTFEVALEAHEVRRPEAPVRFDPPRQVAEWAWREAVDALPAFLIFPNEPRVAKHLEMLRDRGSTHREACRQLGHRDAAALQAVEDRAPRRIGDGMDDVDAGACSGTVY